MTLGKGKRFSNLLSKILKQLKEVQYMSGHRYVSSTEDYYVNDLEDLQDEIEKYHPMG